MVVCLDRRVRGKWPLGIVEKVYPNETDKVVREMDIREAETGRVYRRSARSLFRIDPEPEDCCGDELEQEE